MVAEILAPARPAGAQPVGRQPRLGRRLHPALAVPAQSSVSSRSTRAPSPRWPAALRPRALCVGNLFRDQLDRYGELEHRGGALARRGPRPDRDDAGRRTATTRRSATWRRAARRSVVFGLDDPRHARPSLQHAADSKYCLVLRDAVRVRRRLRGPPRRLPLPCVRPRQAAARRRGPRDRAPRARRRVVPPRHAGRVTGRIRLGLPGLYNVYNAAGRRRARARARRLPRRDRGGPRPGQRRLRTIRADRDRRPAAARAADQEPRRGERGGAHPGRRRRAARGRGRAQRRDRRRPGRLLDLGRRLRAARRRARAARRDGGPRSRARAALQVRRRWTRPRSRSCRPCPRRSTEASSSPSPVASSSSSPPTRRCSRSGRSWPSAASSRPTGSRRHEPEATLAAPPSGRDGSARTTV